MSWLVFADGEGLRRWREVTHVCYLEVTHLINYPLS